MESTYALSNTQPPNLPAAQSEESNNEIITVALKTFRRWWLIALPIGMVIGAVAAGITWHLLPTTYEASAWIEIEDMRPYVISSSGIQDSKKFVATQTQLLTSPMVIESALLQSADLLAVAAHADQEPESFFRKNLRVRTVGNSDLYEIQFESEDPKVAANVVNQIVDSYFRLRDISESKKTFQIIDLLENERLRQGKQVEELRSRVRELGIQVFGSDVFSSEQGTVSVDPQSQNLKERLIATEVERSVTEAELKAFQRLLDSDGIELFEGPVEEVVLSDANVMALQSMMDQKSVSMQQLIDVVSEGKEDIRYQQLEAERAKLAARLNDAKETAREQAVKQLTAQARSQADEKVRSVQARLEALSATEAMLKERLGTAAVDRDASGRNAMAFDFAKAEYERKSEVYEQIAQRILVLKTELQAPTRVSLLRRAQPASSPSGKDRKAMIMAFFGGLVFPFGCAGLWEGLARRISGISELKRYSQTRFNNEICRVPTRRQRSRRSDVFSESIENLRNSILLRDSQRPPQVIAVTSAVAREGKTTVATHLAISLGNSSDKPVLIVDGDLRSPSVADAFDIESDQGLVDVMKGQQDWRNLVDRTQDKVHILAAGELDCTPHQLLQNEAVQSFLTEARNDYSHIIIDTPPILAASESLVLARNADATLICALRDRSRGAQLKQAYDQLTQSNANPVATVLNGVPTWKYVRQYGAYRY